VARCWPTSVPGPLETVSSIPNSDELFTDRTLVDMNLGGRAFKFFRDRGHNESMFVGAFGLGRGNV
jgi:hypothetical protein